MQAHVAGLLGEVTSVLAGFLSCVLPEVSENWWEDAVLKILSFQQRRRLEQHGIVTLASLDLAALLRVLDQNWYQLSTKVGMGTEARHFVKEMQTVRNRWAHAGPEGFPVEDVYRDIDTIQRFAVVINADLDLIDKIRECKTALISRPEASTSVATSAQSEEPATNTEFSVGQIVCLKSNPAVRGAVITVTPGSPEFATRFSSMVILRPSTHRNCRPRRKKAYNISFFSLIFFTPI